MKRSFFFVASLAAALVAPANSADRALFAPPKTRIQQDALLVAAGTAPIEQGLLQIVPPPYRVHLDASVPSTMVLVWGQGDNWMQVLTRALAPAGLVAIPDWSKNAVTVTWRRASPASPASPAQVAAVPAAPASGSIVPAAPPAVMSGSFSVTQPPAPALQILPADPAGAGVEPMRRERSGLAVEWTFPVERDGALPAPEDMWSLMKAAVFGKRIMILGHSGAKSEKSRIWYANQRAAKLRNALLAVGFPAHLVLVNERKEYPTTGDKPRTTIAVVRGDV